MSLLKKFFCLFLVLCSSSFIFGLDVNFDLDEPEYCASAKLTFDFPSHINSVSVYENASFSPDFSTLFSEFRVCNQNDNLDLTLNAVYAPDFYTPFMGNFNLGVSSYLHSEFNYNIYTDIDFLIGLYFSDQFTSLFNLEASVFYMHKGSQIFAIKDFMPWLNTNTMALKLDFNFTINEFFDCGLILSSYNDYKFNDFFTPFWTLYGNYFINDSICAGLDLEFYYIDMFTLSSNLHSVSVSTFVKWYF